MTEKNNPSPPRITFNYILEEILAVFNLNKGFLHSMVYLIISPGRTLRDYFFTAEGRQNMTRPFGFVILTTGIATLIYLRFSDMTEFGEEVMKGMQDANEGKEIADKLNQFMREYYNIMILIGIPFLSWMTMLFFKAPKLYFFEHLVLNSYIFSIVNLLSIPFAFTPLYTEPLYLLGYFVLYLSYVTYVYIRFFEGRVWLKALKSILSSLLAFLLYFVFIFIITLVVTIIVLQINQG